jgi:hypothetical protein
MTGAEWTGRGLRGPRGTREADRAERGPGLAGEGREEGDREGERLHDEPSFRRHPTERERHGERHEQQQHEGRGLEAVGPENVRCTLGRRKVTMKRYVLALLGAASLAMPAAAYDDFYARRLELGKQAFAAGKPADAAEELRVACFGMVDAPAALTECVARLVLAQEGAGRTADANATMDRFLKLEKRFGLFAGTALEPPLKAGFRDLVKKRKGVDLAPPVPTRLNGASDCDSDGTATATPMPTPVATPTPTPTPTPSPTASPGRLRRRATPPPSSASRSPAAAAAAPPLGTTSGR